MAAAVALLAVDAAPRTAAAGAGPVAVTTTEPVDATLGYRANARNDSWVAGATAAPPYKKSWSRDLGSAVSAPVAVGRHVFVVVNADQGDEGGPRMQLAGLDAATGKDLWPQRFLTGEPGATVSYGGGLLYTQTLSGTVAAWDPATGTQKWTVRLGSGSASCQYPPTWYEGVLYTQDGRGLAVALGAADGRRLWTAPLAENGWSTVSVDDAGVWIGFDNIAYHLLDRATGRELRRFEAPNISGPGGNPAVLGAGALWLRNSWSDDEKVVAYDRKSGAALRSFPADATPAFGPGRVYVTYRGVVKAVSTGTYQAVWSWSSPRQVATVRLVAGGYVYVQDGNGELVVLDERTGARVWSHRLWPEPHPMENVTPEADWRGWTVPGVATAQGRLFAQAEGGVLIGFGRA
ncbi:PQQ-binding-like beta-propeller repeat protein [Streptomyces sp. NRRL S-118]|uniref:PQQ-binding-like beta-propeller repeat protein n=1 Tax=Streptomyces sp. NRRL S-118 TaxID=1463881 RepID=UPI0004CA9AE0|nr:PQQ-binding-like beta-propeller repeat protein [Streptomyces sp. NRRL S-118]